jgi:hypothetical protein
MHVSKLKVANAQWKPTVAGTPNQWSGKCEACSTEVPAIQLKLKRLPFGRGEQWVCSGCLYPTRPRS